MRKTNLGMTLMELLVVMAVIGLLAAIAIPSYRSYVMRANRADAKTALLAAAGSLERCFTRFNSYAEADGCAVVFPVNSSNHNYEITATTQTSIAYELTATPLAGQVGDTDCGNFTLDNANARGVSGSRTWQDCWGR